jgi:hypothetical protein
MKVDVRPRAMVEFRMSLRMSYAEQSYPLKVPEYHKELIVLNEDGVEHWCFRNLLVPFIHLRIQNNGEVCVSLKLLKYDYEQRLRNRVFLLRLIPPGDAGSDEVIETCPFALDGHRSLEPTARAYYRRRLEDGAMNLAEFLLTTDNHRIALATRYVATRFKGSEREARSLEETIRKSAAAMGSSTDASGEMCRNVANALIGTLRTLLEINLNNEEALPLPEGESLSIRLLGILYSLATASLMNKVLPVCRYMVATVSSDGGSSEYMGVHFLAPQEKIYTLRRRILRLIRTDGRGMVLEARTLPLHDERRSICFDHPRRAVEIRLPRYDLSFEPGSLLHLILEDLQDTANEIRIQLVFEEAV